MQLRRWTPAIAVAVLAAVAGTGILLASDHQDNPEVELNPRMDMTDVYAFPSPTAGRIVLVMNTSPFLTPAQAPTAAFDPNLLYQFKIDNSGDAVEDRVVQVTFEGTGAGQRVHVRGPVAPPVVGAMNNTLADGGAKVDGTIGTPFGAAGAMQAFAGVRDDPFFIDLEQFFRIIPDRKPTTGSLSQLPDQPTATAFRPAGQALNYVAGFDVLSIVVELPVAELTAGGTSKLGIWGTVSR
jgi:Domain of unknown function (DUF4331)